MFRNPSCNPLTELNPKVIDQVGVGIFRSAQHQLPLLENINEAGITGNDRGYKFNNAAQHHMKRVGCGNSAADLVQKINGRQAVAKTCHGWRGWRNPVHAREARLFSSFSTGLVVPGSVDTVREASRFFFWARILPAY